MRYRIGESPTESAYAGSVHFVELTVFITLLIGIGFLFFGIRGKQSWMTIYALAEVKKEQVYNLSHIILV